MPTSQARIDANRRNAQLSSGPKTAEGKEHSRRNAFKHGMAGAGVVLPELDSAEVERRNDELQAELAPRSAMGQILVRDLATLSVRMERSARQESAAIAGKVRHAIEDFDQSRLDDAERRMAALGEDPRKNLRNLRRSPEGVEALLDAWNDLRDALPNWNEGHRERAVNLTGRRVGDAGTSPIDSLARAILGDLSALPEKDSGQLAPAERRDWARSRMIERIETEIAQLEAHYETLDFETIAIDRAEAPLRATFDDSKEATLARRYDSAARRGFYKTLKELRRAEAEIEAQIQAAAASKPQTAPAPLGSSRARDGAAPREPRPAPSPSRVGADAAVVQGVGRVDVAGWSASSGRVLQTAGV